MDLTEGMCHVWWAPRSAASRELTAVLAEHERVRHRRFLREEDRDRYLVAHSLARIVLGGHSGRPPGDLVFEAVCNRCGGPHGKPRLRDGDLEFSITHSGEYSGVAVSRGVPVGLDVERRISDRDLGTLASSVLSAEEDLGPDPATALTAYWTRKEAVLKATGDGLSVSPRDLTVTSHERPPALLSWPAGPPAVHLYGLRPGPGHLACLAALAPVRVQERDGTQLL